MIEKENTNLYFILSKSNFDSHYDYIVEILANNIVDEQILNNEKIALTQFLIKRLNYETLKIEIKVKHEDKKEIIYSPRDKFEFLNKKNPELSVLKNNFDANIKY
jgi:DNA polymerase-3 subunit gamma/tau